MSAEFALIPPLGSELYEHPFTETERLFILRRPLDMNVASSVRARHTIRSLYNQLDAFEDHGITTDLHEADTACDAAGMAAIFDRYRITDNDGVMVIGGDGTASNANSGALQAGYRGPLVHVGRGNARDQAHMLFHKRFIKDPLAAMVHSTLKDLYLLELTARSPDLADPQTLHATGYLSFGDLIHDVASTVGSDEFRESTKSMGRHRQFIAETQAMLGTIGTGQLITIEDNDGTRQRSDLLLPLGERMAKSVRFRGLHLLEPGFGRVELRRSTKPAIAAGLGRTAIGAFRHLAPDTEYEFVLHTHDESPVQGQVDGEVFKFPSGTHFTARIDLAHPVRVATTKAHAA